MSEHVAGIDVSNWQGHIDWTAVSQAGIRWAVTKATEGIRYVDPSHVRNVAGARANNITVGAYHFANLRAPADVEAAHYLAHVADVDFHVLDFETVAAGLDHTGWARTWLQTVEAATGTLPWLYTGTYLPLDHRLLARWPLWLAQYTANDAIDPNPLTMPQPRLPANRDRWDAWQYTSKGRVPGVNGNCDRNIAHPDLIAPQEDDMPDINEIAQLLDQKLDAKLAPIGARLGRLETAVRSIDDEALADELENLAGHVADVEDELEGRDANPGHPSVRKLIKQGFAGLGVDLP